MNISEILQSLRDCDYAECKEWADAIEAEVTREKDAEIEAFGRAIDNWVEITKNLLTTLGATQDKLEDCRESLREHMAMVRGLLERLRERDERVERLKALLAEARDDIRENVEAQRPDGLRHYPAEMRRYERDMDIVHRINAALNTEAPR